MTRKSTSDLLLCRRMPISHKTRDQKCARRRQLQIVLPVTPGVTAKKEPVGVGQTTGLGSFNMNQKEP